MDTAIPVVLGVCLFISEVMSLVPAKYVPANGILDTIFKVAKFVIAGASQTQAVAPAVASAVASTPVSQQKA